MDIAFETTSPGLIIEFQGGEPLVNWPVVQHIIEYALQKNALAGKQLSFALVTNLSLMDDEKLDYLVDRRVQMCTSLDGPADIHDQVRHFSGGASHELTVGWMARINAAYRALGLDPHQYRVEALPTVTRLSLRRATELIDHFAAVGCNAVFLRALDPLGFAATTRRKLGYTSDEFLAFYDEALDRVVSLNREGRDFVERNAAMIFAKVLGHHEPNFLDLRSPCGAGIGQLAYNYDGRVFTCDEGRMVDRADDDCFALGDVGQASYRDLVTHKTVGAMVLASTLDGVPHCATCVYKPWCGVCPVHNYVEQGSIHGRMADSSWCRRYMGLFDLLMTRLQRADDFERTLFERWARVREQTHFVHDGDESLSAS